MNGKTAKLLRKFANEYVDLNYGRLKKWWYSLNHIERGKARREIEEELESISKEQSVIS